MEIIWYYVQIDIINKVFDTLFNTISSLNINLHTIFVNFVFYQNFKTKNKTINLTASCTTFLCDVLLPIIVYYEERRRNYGKVNRSKEWSGASHYR